MALKLIMQTAESETIKQIDEIIGLIKQAEQHIRYQNCATCKISGASQINQKLEEHHIGGKANFDDTVTVCLDCHDFLSDHQKAWLPTKKTRSNEIISYFLGWADIFDLLYKKTMVFCFLKLARKFRSQVYHLRSLAN